MKLPNTKTSKQLGGYCLIKSDLEFAGRAFHLASTCNVRSLEERRASRPSLQDKAKQLFSLDPILRKGAIVLQSDPDNRSGTEITRYALFEAGIIIYGRCFSQGIRVRLSRNIFRGKLSAAKSLHDRIIEVRNKHVAHSEMRMELAKVACDLVIDENYGKRPNAVISVIAARRHAPNNEKLIELREHCSVILRKVVEPKILMCSNALREELLAMPKEECDGLPVLETASKNLDEIW